jgi:hypothetical protein
LSNLLLSHFTTFTNCSNLSCELLRAARLLKPMKAKYKPAIFSGRDALAYQYGETAGDAAPSAHHVQKRNRADKGLEVVFDPIGYKCDLKPKFTIQITLRFGLLVVQSPPREWTSNSTRWALKWHSLVNLNRRFACSSKLQCMLPDHKTNLYMPAHVTLGKVTQVSFAPGGSSMLSNAYKGASNGMLQSFRLTTSL